MEHSLLLAIVKMSHSEIGVALKSVYNIRDFPSAILHRTQYCLLLVSALLWSVKNSDPGTSDTFHYVPQTVSMELELSAAFGL